MSLQPTKKRSNLIFQTVPNSGRNLYQAERIAKGVTMRRLGYDDYMPRARKQRRFSLSASHYFLIVLAIVTITYVYIRDRKPQLLGIAPSNTPLTCLFTDGGGEIFRKKLDKRVDAVGNFQFFAEDQLETDKSIRTILQFDGESNIRVGPSTTFTYESGKGQDFNLRVDKGMVFLEAFAGGYTITTPLGIVKIGDGVVLIDYKNKSAMKIYCMKGNASITSRHEKDRTVELLGGQRTLIELNNTLAQPSDFTKYDLDDWGRWNCSFSAARMKAGEIPPPYIIAAKTKKKRSTGQAQGSGTYDQTMKEDTQSASPGKKPSVNDPQYPRTKIYSSSGKPVIPKSGNAYTSNPPSGKKLSPPPAKPVQAKANNSNSRQREIERQEFERKSRGAFYYTDNERRRKKNPGKIPGMSIGSDPIGPAEFSR